MKIIADTPCLYTPEEGRSINLSVIPSCTIIDNEVYRDLEDITSEEFLSKISEGAVPTTSQPAIGDILEVFESSQEEMLVLPIGDGLSGTYQNMLSAKNMIENNDHIHVMDTRTLAGPQHYLVRKAMQLRELGKDIEAIKRELQKCIENSVSFVIPSDFNFLKRSGRLTPAAAKIGTILKIVPVMTQTEDMRRITLFTIKRSKKNALAAIINHLKNLGVNKDWLITISHGGAVADAKAVMAQFREHFADSAMELFQLIPSLICHGGPGCIVIQAIRM